jgi:AcrR family transcriptional regulator
MPKTGLSPNELRERALHVAEDRIRLDGFDRVRLADIARDLSISHVALYKHYPDKAALLDAVTLQWLRSLHEALEKIAQSPKGVGVRLPSWFRTYHHVLREKALHDPELFRAFISAWSNKTPSATLHGDTIHHQLDGMVQEAMQIGLLLHTDPRSDTLLLLEATIGFHHPRLVAEKADENREPALRRVLETVLQGLG